MIDETITRSDINSNVFVFSTDRYDYLFYGAVFLAKKDRKSKQYWCTLYAEKNYRELVDRHFKC